ncbi:hypothetical protein NP493_739g02012 [Ridgeia piscesae]|uniref:Uncharacterized protein n=1 Tax=Ridgeia piscesae TaxID=27915 RepID=A0AAD9KQ32_RIDPI|nr:hypothetical protein NP493_739g02012 [Ridgeia piscesae]
MHLNNLRHRKFCAKHCLFALISIAPISISPARLLWLPLTGTLPGLLMIIKLLTNWTVTNNNMILKFTGGK